MSPALVPGSTAPDVGVVVTAYNQAGMIREAVDSALHQSAVPRHIVVVDDGSTDPRSLAVLDELRAEGAVDVVRQDNGGVSSARNLGISHCRCDVVVVLDGDDRLLPTFVERAVTALVTDPQVVAVSSWMRMFGLAHARVRPTGGHAVDLLARNACPADVMVRRSAWERAGGYDESLRSGFEDWDFFLRLLGDTDDARIFIVEEELIDYRTARASANVSSMEERSSLLRGLVNRHRSLYLRHLDELVTSLDALATRRLHDWEDLVVASGAQVPAEASFGDGGMASVVRIASARAGTDPHTPRR